jgi:hypothetical protein
MNTALSPPQQPLTLAARVCEPYDVWTMLRDKRRYVHVCVPSNTTHASLARQFGVVLKAAGVDPTTTFVVSGTSSAARMVFYYLRDVLRLGVVLFVSRHADSRLLGALSPADSVVLDVAQPNDVDEFLRCLVSARVELRAAEPSASLSSVAPTRMAARFYPVDIRRMYRMQ